MDKIADAQSHIDGLEVAEMGVQYAMEFRGIYPEHILGNMLAVGPMQSYVGLAIKNGHLVPADEVAELREQLATARAALQEIAGEDEIHTKLNEVRLCCKFQDIAVRALGAP